MTKFLYIDGVTKFLYIDVASMLLKQYPRLGVMEDSNGHYALKILAEKPSAFPSGTKYAFWEKLIYHCKLGFAFIGLFTTCS